jgi:hypothetical protein
MAIPAVRGRNPHFKDIAGERFGRLMAIEPIPGTYSPVKWRCICDCGRETRSSGSHLRGGRTQSCGCAYTPPKVRKPRGDFIDILDQVFGRLTVVERVGARPVKWRCKCECGGETITLGRSLREGHTRSCGCLIGETAKKTMTTHGQSRTALYATWTGMILRCSNPNFKQWDDYGGRGIKVCDRWRHSFENFLADLGERPSPKHTLDRMDVDGNYEPGNCRWATRAEQVENKRKVARIELFTTEELRAELPRREYAAHRERIESYESSRPGTHTDRRSTL